MQYGMYISASGMLTSMYRQDVHSHNLANLQTVSFKPDLPSVRQRAVETLENGHPLSLKHKVLDQLGGGVFAGKQHIHFAPGTLRRTGNPLDLALTGRNAFLRAQGSEPGKTYLTRDGRLSINDQGELVMASNGRPILDDGDNPITPPLNSELSISTEGELRANGTPIAQLAIVGVNDLNRLMKVGESLYDIGGDGNAITEPDTKNMRNEFVEDSSVNPISTLMNVIGSSKAVSSNAQMIQYHDELLQRTVQTFGRVSL